MQMSFNTQPAGCAYLFVHGKLCFYASSGHDWTTSKEKDKDSFVAAVTDALTTPNLGWGATGPKEVKLKIVYS